MFARTAPAGWDVFGNEVESSIDIAGNEPATKCVEQSGTHINEGAKVFASGTEEQAEQIATKCVEQSGTDIIAIEEPGMVAKSEPEPEQKHNWPIEVLEIVNQALDQCQIDPVADSYQQLCSHAKSLLLAGTHSEIAVMAEIIAMMHGNGQAVA